LFGGEGGEGGKEKLAISNISALEECKREDPDREEARLESFHIKKKRKVPFFY